MRAKKGQHVRRGVGTEPATIIRLCTTVVDNTAVSDGKRFRHHILKTKYKYQIYREPVACKPPVVPARGK